MLEPGSTAFPQGDGVAAADPSVRPAFSTIKGNFLVADMGSSTTVDTDDGTSYWLVEENLSIFGGAKQDFGGHDLIQRGNLFVYAKVIHHPPPSPGSFDVTYSESHILIANLSFNLAAHALSQVIALWTHVGAKTASNGSDECLF